MFILGCIVNNLMTNLKRCFLFCSTVLLTPIQMISSAAGIHNILLRSPKLQRATDTVKLASVAQAGGAGRGLAAPL